MALIPEVFRIIPSAGMATALPDTGTTHSNENDRSPDAVAPAREWGGIRSSENPEDHRPQHRKRENGGEFTSADRFCPDRDNMNASESTLAAGDPTTVFGLGSAGIHVPEANERPLANLKILQTARCIGQKAR